MAAFAVALIGGTFVFDIATNDPISLAFHLLFYLYGVFMTRMFVS